jgi:DNA topoisomerase VI subunit B
MSCLHELVILKRKLKSILQDSGKNKYNAKKKDAIAKKINFISNKTLNYLKKEYKYNLYFI